MSKEIDKGRQQLITELDEQQKLNQKLQSSRQFFQDQMKILDDKLNEDMCKLADIFYQNSQKMKTAIFEQWKKAYQQIHNNEDQNSRYKHIQFKVKSLVQKSSKILEVASQQLQDQPPQEKPTNFVTLQSDDEISHVRNQTQLNYSPIRQKPYYHDSIDSQTQEQEIQGESVCQCPICGKQMSNGSTFVKHLKFVHKISVQSQGFDCPNCDASYGQAKQLLTHLFKTHYVEEQFQDRKRKSYYCPFTQQSFQINQLSQLSHIIRTSPHYSKALKQVLEDKKDQKHYLLPQVECVQFIRGVTKIPFKNQLYTCPLCGAEDMVKLKYVASHIKNEHGIKFRNNLICPHCKLETKSAYTLAHHLISIHSVQQSVFGGQYKQVYQSVSSKDTFDDVIKLGKHLLHDENYLTFFSPNCDNDPVEFIKEQIDEEEDVEKSICLAFELIHQIRIIKNSDQVLNNYYKYYH